MSALFYILLIMAVAIVTGVIGHAYGYMRAERVGKKRLVHANNLHVQNVRAIDAEHYGRLTQAQADAYGDGYRQAKADLLKLARKANHD